MDESGEEQKIADLTSEETSTLIGEAKEVSLETSDTPATEGISEIQSSTGTTEPPFTSSISSAKVEEVEEEQLQVTPSVIPTGKTPYEVNIQKQIIMAFEVLDPERTGRIDLKNLKVLVRALCLCPSEEDLSVIFNETRMEDSDDVDLHDLLPVLTRILVEDKFRQAPPGVLLEAFQILDTNSQGFLTKDELFDYFAILGEPFEQEELDEFFAQGKNVERNFDFLSFYEKLEVPNIIPW